MTTCKETLDLWINGEALSMVDGWECAKQIRAVLEDERALRLGIGLEEKLGLADHGRMAPNARDGITKTECHVPCLCLSCKGDAAKIAALTTQLDAAAAKKAWLCARSQAAITVPFVLAMDAALISPHEPVEYGSPCPCCERNAPCEIGPNGGRRCVCCMGTGFVDGPRPPTLEQAVATPQIVPVVAPVTDAEAEAGSLLVNQLSRDGARQEHIVRELLTRDRNRPAFFRATALIDALDADGGGHVLNGLIKATIIGMANAQDAKSAALERDKSERDASAPVAPVVSDERECECPALTMPMPDGDDRECSACRRFRSLNKTALSPKPVLSPEPAPKTAPKRWPHPELRGVSIDCNPIWDEAREAINQALPGNKYDWTWVAEGSACAVLMVKYAPNGTLVDDPHGTGPRCDGDSCTVCGPASRDKCETCGGGTDGATMCDSCAHAADTADGMDTNGTDAASKSNQAISCLLTTLHLYPNYRVDSRGPYGLILGALEALAPAVATRLRDGVDAGSILREIEESGAAGDDAGAAVTIEHRPEPSIGQTALAPSTPSPALVVLGAKMAALIGERDDGFWAKRMQSYVDGEDHARSAMWGYWDALSEEIAATIKSERAKVKT